MRTSRARAQWGAGGDRRDQAARRPDPRRRWLVLAALLAVAVVVATACTAAPTSVATNVPATTSGPPATVAPLVACGAQATFPYATVAGVDPSLTSLDVYRPAGGADGCEKRPLVIWVHGGGWTSGDKSAYIADKVALFNGAGDVLVSVNYRLTDKTLPQPAPQYPVHDQDVADAVAWLVGHAPALGVDPNRIAIIGHSAGGGITAAVATDDTYLGAHQLPLTTLRCAASLDGEGYDITAGATTADPAVQTGYRNAFGSDPAVWERASPVRHVQAGAGIPAYFVAARGDEWRLAQHQAFIAALRAAGVPTTVLDASSLQHADLDVSLGAAGDTTLTPAVMQFLAGCLS